VERTGGAAVGPEDRAAVIGGLAQR